MLTRIWSFKLDPLYNPDKSYEFDKYIKSFLENKVALEKNFSFLYETILHYLIDLDKREPLYKLLDKQLLISLKEILNKKDIGEKFQYKNFNDLLREVGLLTFFKD